MSLQAEIEIVRATIRTDSYPMSIGEWMNLYESDEIDIHPEFQRFFRWDENQKSRFIESLLLGIPIPPIFVSQRKDGVWDVVDGLQRLSTLFEFFGILKDEKKENLPALSLEKTDYLPSLQGKYWQHEDEAQSFSNTQRLIIKRSKIDASIILYESDEKAKFELFQRLNTGGSKLSDQEIRNSILVMLNPDIYKWIKDLSNNENFQQCIAITEKSEIESYDLDLITRFILLRNIDIEKLRGLGDVNYFLNKEMIEVVKSSSIDIAKEFVIFQEVFRTLNEVLADNSFRKFNVAKSKFGGGFLISAFEVIALGLGFNSENISTKKPNIESIVKELWSNEDFLRYSGSGIRASSRLPNNIPLGRRIFSS